MRETGIDILDVKLSDLRGASDLALLEIAAPQGRFLRHLSAGASAPVWSSFLGETAERGRAESLVGIRRERFDNAAIPLGLFPRQPIAEAAALRHLLLDSPDMRRLGLGEALPAKVILDREGKVVCQKRGVITKASFQPSNRAGEAEVAGRFACALLTRLTK